MGAARATSHVLELFHVPQFSAALESQRSFCLNIPPQMRPLFTVDRVLAMIIGWAAQLLFIRTDTQETGSGGVCQR